MMGLLAPTEAVAVAEGMVEVLRIDGYRPPVLFFPGGHCTAQSDCGWNLYTDAGFGVISFSRPAYGGTKVGLLSAAEFAPILVEVCDRLGVDEVAASVGVSFGGMQAIASARQAGLNVSKLILHSCAPSVFPFRDSSLERRTAPRLFSPVAQRSTWRALRLLVRTDAGLRKVLAQMSTLPPTEVWASFSADDRARVRALFQTMQSDRGFVLDLAEASADRNAERQAVLEAVTVPTLVTGSPFDASVPFDHAVSLADTIPNAELVETASLTHLGWIGAGSDLLADAVAAFLGSSSN